MSAFQGLFAAMRKRRKLPPKTPLSPDGLRLAYVAKMILHPENCRTWAVSDAWLRRLAGRFSTLCDKGVSHRAILSRVPSDSAECLPSAVFAAAIVLQRHGTMVIMEACTQSSRPR